MRFSGDEVGQLLFCCSAVRRARQSSGQPISPWLLNLIRRLELDVAVSASGQEQSDHESRCDHDEWIGTVEAARILRWNERTLRRRASDLDGRKVAGKLVFHASTVHEYAEALTDARSVS